MEPSKSNDILQTRRELLIYAAMQLVCLGLTFGVFALLHKLTGKVLLGGAVGCLTAVGNYAMTAVGVFRAADKAEAGDVAGARRVITTSQTLRYLGMIAVLVIGAKSGYCDVIAMLVPLLLSRILIYAGELFRRKEG
jgi:hypothetical protein